MGCILSFNINSIKLNTTEYTGTECSKVQYLIALMKQRRKGKRHTRCPGTNVILKYPGLHYFLMPKIGFAQHCMSGAGVHVRSQCVSYILILHGNTGHFLSVGRGQRNRISMVPLALEPVIWSANLMYFFLMPCSNIIGDLQLVTGFSVH